MSARGVPVLQVAVVSAALTYACVRIPEFTYQDAAPADGDAGTDAGSSGPAEVRTFTNGSGELVVELPGVYAMTFSNADMFLPRSLVIGGTEVFGPGGVGNCHAEQGQGVAYYPAAILSGLGAEGGSAAATNSITVEVPGPPIVKVGVNWAAEFVECNGMATGRSTFTFFPDGRITRMDVLRMPQESDAADCSCVPGAGTTWILTSYYTFADDVSVDPDQIGSNVADEGPPDGPVVCMTGSAHQIAIGHYPMFARRIRRTSVDDFALVYDLFRSGSSAVAGSATFMTDGITTMWVARDSDCAALRDLAQPFTDNVQLMLNGTTYGLAQDGMYGGETSQTNGSGGRDFGGNTLIVTTTQEHPDVGAFAVWAVFGSSSSIASVTRTPPSSLEPWYRQQSVPFMPDHYIFWFPEGLGSGQSIVIEAQ